MYSLPFSADHLNHGDQLSGFIQCQALLPASLGGGGGGGGGGEAGDVAEEDARVDRVGALPAGARAALDQMLKMDEDADDAAGWSGDGDGNGDGGVSWEE